MIQGKDASEGNVDATMNWDVLLELLGHEVFMRLPQRF